MVDREIALMLIGAGIALFSSLMTALVQHFLALRVDRIKRERDQQAQGVVETKRSLASGKTLSQLEEEITKMTTFLSVGLEEDLSMPKEAAEAVPRIDKLPRKLPKLQLHSRRLRPSSADDEKEAEERRTTDS